MDKKTIQKHYLEAYYIDNTAVLEVLEVWQDCPSTAVHVTVYELPSIDGVFGIGEDYAIGFSKVNWPDVWSETTGVNIAVEKAIAKLAKRYAT